MMGKKCFIRQSFLAIVFINFLVLTEASSAIAVMTFGSRHVFIPTELLLMNYKELFVNNIMKISLLEWHS